MIVFSVTLIHLIARCALQEVISTRPLVGNDAFVRPISSKDHPISTWATTRVDLAIAQDRELIVWSRIREWETFAVFVLVRIPAGANCVALLNGSVYVRLRIAC